MRVRRRVLAVVIAAGAISAPLAVVGPGVASATPAVTVPPACLKVPIPNPVVPDAQLQLGYCP
jgi:hypothetical protein